MTPDRRMAGFFRPLAPERARLAALLRGCPVLSLPAILAVPRGLGAALGASVLLAAGFAVVAVVWASWSEPAGVTVRRWTETVLVGLMLGLLSTAAWTVTGGPGWAARLAILAATGLWVIASSAERPEVAFGALLAFLALGYTSGAGILYYLGQPLALVTILAGRAAQSHVGRAVPGRNRGLMSTAYVIAGVALVLSAWVDLV